MNNQNASRTGRDAVSAQTIRARASRNEAMSFLDTIDVTGRSHTSGTIAQAQSRSDRPTWRRDARTPPRTSRYRRDTISERDRRPMSSRRTEPRSAAARSDHSDRRAGTHCRDGDERRNASERRNGASRATRTTRHRVVLRYNLNGTHRDR
jgi:hypothetical protein